MLKVLHFNAIVHSLSLAETLLVILVSAATFFVAYSLLHLP